MLSGSHTVPVFLGSADPEGFEESALSRRGDDDGAAVLHSLGPAEIEEAVGERGAYRTGDVWPAFGPVETQSTEMTAG